MTNVGAGLPAIAVAQLNIQWLTRRLRGQARSHRDLCQALIFCGQCVTSVGAGLPAKAVAQLNIQ